MAFDWTLKTIFYILVAISVLMAMIIWYVSFNPDIEGGVFYSIFRIISFLTQPRI